jgi:hypothetical protein
MTFKSTVKIFLFTGLGLGRSEVCLESGQPTTATAAAKPSLGVASGTVTALVGRIANQFQKETYNL